MKFSHHKMCFEVEDDWLAEAGMTGFVGKSNSYRSANTSAFKVPIGEVGPLFRVPLFRDDPFEERKTSRERVLRLLRGFRADDVPFDWTVDDKAVVFTSNRTGAGGVFNIFRQRIDEASAEMVVSGPEQKTISRLSPDGSQILYLVPPNPGDNGGQRRSEVSDTKSAGITSQNVRLMRAALDGGPPQIVVEAPNIDNYQCSRAPADVCVLSRMEARQTVLFTFDSVKGESARGGKA